MSGIPQSVGYIDWTQGVRQQNRNSRQAPKSPSSPQRQDRLCGPKRLSNFQLVPGLKRKRCEAEPQPQSSVSML